MEGNTLRVYPNSHCFRGF